MIPIFFIRSSAVVSAAVLFALAGLLCVPAAARADDSLTLIAGAQQTAFFEVLEYVAEDAGFFKELHLHVDVQFAGNPGSAAQLVASGKGDVCSISTEPIIQGYDKGLRLQAFFSRDPQYLWVLAVLADSPIRTLSDFKGATLGEYSPGSPAELSTNAMLQGAGLKKSDTSYLVIGGGAQAISALNDKKVAGAAFPYPELAIYEAVAGLKFRFFWNPLLKDIGDVAFAATPATIQNKSEALKHFSRAMAEASILIRENPQLAARYFVHGVGGKPTDDALQSETRLLQISQDQLPASDPNSKTIGLMGARGLGVYSAWMADAGMTAHVVPVSAIVTDAFIPYANDFDHRALIAKVKAMH
jgi:NitT/TauT family transport system substrate-binding protein